MEQEKDEYIGQLFRASFDGHKQAPEQEEWETLQTSMQRLNFFKFNALQFNIYYAGMIAFCFLTCLGMGTHYTFSHVINPHHLSENNASVTTSDSQKNENQNKKDESISNPSNLKIIRNSGSGEGNSSNVINTSNHDKSEKNNDQKSDDTKSNVLTPEDLNSGSKPVIFSNPAIKIDSSYKSIQHKQNAPESDSSKIKKRTIYITKQDTIYKYDTLRAPKPKRRRF